MTSVSEARSWNINMLRDVILIFALHLSAHGSRQMVFVNKFFEFSIQSLREQKKRTKVIRKTPKNWKRQQENLRTIPTYHVFREYCASSTNSSEFSWMRTDQFVVLDVPYCGRQFWLAKRLENQMQIRCFDLMFLTSWCPVFAFTFCSKLSFESCLSITNAFRMHRKVLIFPNYDKE